MRMNQHARRWMLRPVAHCAGRDLTPPLLSLFIADDAPVLSPILVPSSRTPSRMTRPLHTLPYSS
jgi:hypothetical protein